jgi:hypothetical protein
MDKITDFRALSTQTSLRSPLCGVIELSTQQIAPCTLIKGFYKLLPVVYALPSVTTAKPQARYGKSNFSLIYFS